MKRLVPFALAAVVLSTWAAPGPLRGEESGVSLGAGGFLPFQQRFSDVYGPGIALSLRSFRSWGPVRLFAASDLLYNDGYGTISYDLAGGSAPDTYATYLKGIVAQARYEDAFDRSGTPSSGCGWSGTETKIMMVPLAFGASYSLVRSPKLSAEVFAGAGPVLGAEWVSGNYRAVNGDQSSISGQRSLFGGEARAGFRFTLPLHSYWNLAFDAGGAFGSLRPGRGTGAVQTTRLDLRAGVSYAPPAPSPTPRMAEPSSPTPTTVPLETDFRPLPTSTPSPEPAFPGGA